MEQRTESELSKTIYDARQADAIVNHPLFIAAITTLKKLTIDTFENLGFDDTKEMQECNVRLNLIEEFEIHLKTIINDGVPAFKALEEIQSFNQRKQR